MRLRGLAALATLMLTLNQVCGDTSDSAPDFKEVYELVRSHLAGVTDAELNQAAVDGFLSSLRGKVTLLGKAQPVPTNTPAFVEATLLESNVAYIRLAGLDERLPAMVTNVVAGWSTTNSLVGLILDLRFAQSEDYASAAAVADLFQTQARPLLDWGAGVIRSHEKRPLLRLPITVLVNRETSGAAEALAALLRETGVGLIFGSNTAGNALIGQDFALQDGRRLRVATTPVKVGEGIELSLRGVAPDIFVAVSLTEERAWLGDPYGLSRRRTNELAAAGASATGNTNRATRRPRPNEADLVRARRDGVSLDAEFLDGREAEPARPVIRDPVLARAVDVLKGLAVVRATRS